VRILLDACVWAGAAAVLREAGHDVICAGDWPVDPGDEEIISRAAREQRVLITLDKDFGELAVVHRRPHAGILRLVGFQAAAQGPKALETLAVYAPDLTQGGIVTVEPGRVRVRSPEKGAS
jgi:predicted nuclease of predicted toxin-antitoxin system